MVKNWRGWGRADFLGVILPADHQLPVWVGRQSGVAAGAKDVAAADRGGAGAGTRLTSVQVTELGGALWLHSSLASTQPCAQGQQG